MVRKVTLHKKRRPTKSKARQEKIAVAIAELDQIKPASTKTAKTIAMLKSWLADESGYDEAVWPQLRKALERERERVGARRLFDG